jgi:phosphoribosyl 1,2-cyclic phosphate phosphodiesterase
LRITFLGTGTSQGVPLVGCKCPVCCSPDPKNNRKRPSLWLEFAGKSVLIDTSPEFRLQALECGISHIDAVLFTHAHADHIFGFDDIRRFNQMQRQTIPIYASANTIAVLKGLFSYAFAVNEDNWAVPRARAMIIDGNFSLFGQLCQPLLVYHGALPVTAFRIGNFAYVTDCSLIPAKTMSQLYGLDVLVIDALRYRPHTTHFNVDQALQVINTLQPKQAYLTHMCHEVEHTQLAASLPPTVAPAYDGLVIEVSQPPTKVI